MFPIPYSYFCTGSEAGANNITYGDGDPTGNTTAAESLARAYDMSEREGADMDSGSSLDATDRYQLDDWSGATTAYRNERNRVAP